MMNVEAPIYLDYAAATPLDDRVFAAMQPYARDAFYNPSAPYSVARGAAQDVRQARTQVAHAIGARPDNITFTAGATEANNLAFASVDGQVITSAIEHESVLACARAHPGGYQLVKPSDQGLIDPADIASALTPQTELVSIALANGEIGTLQPLRKIATIVRAERMRRLEAGQKRPIWLHTDASQAAATQTVNVSSLGVDMLTLSAAKLYGPKQVGLLWAADDVLLRPLILGGGQEGGLRSGTENVSGIIGFARALQIACKTRRDQAKRLAKMRDTLQARLLSAFPDAIVSGPHKQSLRLASLLNISFPHLVASRLVIALDEHGVLVGTGSACAASKMEISPVLEAIGLAADVAKGSLRITLGYPTTRKEIDRASKIMECVIRDAYERVGV